MIVLFAVIPILQGNRPECLEIRVISLPERKGAAYYYE
jgi:hypothetical protein